MMKHLIERLIAFTGRRLPWVAAVLLLLGALSLFGVVTGSFTNDMSQLFPGDGEAANTFRVLRETRLSGTVNVEFVSDSDIEKHRPYLDRVAAALEKVPGAHNVLFRYRSDDVLDEWSSFSRLVPRFFTPDVLDGCDPDAAAKNALKQLSFPTPGGAKRLRNQPFGIENRMLAQLKRLDELAGMRLAPELGFLASRDRRRAMIVFDADLPPGDAAGVRKLFADVRKAVEPVPEGVTWRIVSGATHTLGNEETLKRDATVAGAVSLVLFALLFWIFYRHDPKALWIPAVPALASLLTLGVMTLIFKEICLYVVGLGSCITGLAVDQGIHVYAACRTGDAARRTAALAEPMALSAGSSILVFVLLGATGIGAYVQLAVFAGGALFLSALIALLVLPHLFGSGTAAPASPMKLGRLPRPVVIALLVLLAVAAAPGARRVLKRADFSLAALDGTPERMLAEEADFNAAWRREGAHTAVLAAVGADKDAALAKLRKCVAELADAGVNIATAPQPPVPEQIANRELWRSAETRAALAKLDRECRESCLRNKLPARFFDPFFTALAANAASDDLSLPPMLAHLERKMVKTHPGGASAVALLEDTPENSLKVRRVLKKAGGGDLALLAKEGFRTMIRDELGSRFKLVMLLSAAGAFALLFVVFRNLRDMLLAMVPVFVSFTGLAVLGGACGFRATPAAAFALVLLTGLAVDYGVYAVCEARAPGELSVKTPVLLSAATTVAGAGALIFSHHPALYGTGVVLAVGVALAAAGGLWLVPMLRDGRGGMSSRHPLGILLAALISTLAAGCASAPEDPALRAEAERQFSLYPRSPFRVRALATLSGSGTESRFILAAEIDPVAGTAKASGVDPGSGALIFRGDSAGGVVDAGMFPQLSPPVRRVFGGVPRDLARIFLFKGEDLLAVRRKSGYIAADSRDGAAVVIRAGAVERRHGSFPFRSWECAYRDSGRRVDYANHDGGYRLSVRIAEIK